MYNVISSHEGKFSDDDAAKVLNSVEANAVIQAESALEPLSINTIWNLILDLNDRSVKVKFLLKKSLVDKTTNRSALIFTSYLAFRMNNSSMQH